jgi:phosphoglycerate dehydrogenase-like enzyme
MTDQTLLLLEPAFERIGSQIMRSAPELRILTMSNDGGFQSAGTVAAVPSMAPTTDPTMAPTIAWMGIDLYSCPSAQTFTKRVLESSALQWVQTALAGVEAPIFKQLMDNGVRLSSSDAQAPSIGDFVVGSVMAHLQRYAYRRELQAKRQWQPFQFRELGRTRWLIVGYGSIGQEVAQRVCSFGAQVVGIRRQPQAATDITVLTPDALADELPKADVVVLACSLTDATRGMVDSAFLNQMKAQSILVNVGRGGLVVDSDLLSALDDGHVEHAILDVFDPEPLPESHRYWEHPSVLVGSHGSSFGDGMSDRGDELFLHNLRRFLAGEVLHKEVHAIG